MKDKNFINSLILRRHSIPQGFILSILGCCLIAIFGLPIIKPIVLFFACGIFLLLSLSANYLSNNLDKLCASDKDEDREDLRPYKKRYFRDRLFFISFAALFGMLGLSLLFPYAWIVFPAVAIAVKALYNIALMFTDGERKRYYYYDLLAGIGIIILAAAYRDPTNQSFNIDRYGIIYQGIFLVAASGTAIYHLVRMFLDKKIIEENLKSALLNIGIIFWNILCHCILKL